MAQQDKHPQEPQTESPADRFKRVAGRRTEAAMVAIRRLNGTASKATYEYTDEQVAKIIGALRSEVEKLEQSYAGKVSAGSGFEL